MSPVRAMVPAEVAMAAVGLAVVAGFDRVFAGGHLGPLVATLAAVQLTTAFARRRRWGLPLTALVTAGAVSLVVAWTVFGHTTTFGLPTLSTLEVAADELTEGWRAFRDVVAPAPALPGLLMSACAGLAFAMFLADWAAFRLWSPFEALVAPFALFLFCTMLGTDSDQVRSAGLFAAAVVALLLTHRLGTSGGRLGRSGPLALTGTAMGVLAIVAGTTLAPMLPGATDEALLDWRGDRGETGQRTTISPLVDIRNRLANRSGQDVFRVESTERSYWRLTALDDYEGGVWRSSGRYRAVDGELPDTTQPAAATEIDQLVTIQSLEAIWLPAAFEPVAVDAGRDVRWMASSSTLIVDTDVPTSDGMTYAVRSARPDTDADALRSFDGTVPEELRGELTAIPVDDEGVVGDLARTVTDGRATPYDEMLALQDWFRTQFTYDLGVPPGHDTNAIRSFLDVRRGYCEQFAGTFAVMARSLGLPARVAVGFTTGEQVGSDPDVYQVRGEHAHAWPEVWMGEHGWIAFEPTPGRGAPGAAHTGLPEEQAAPGGPGVAPTTATTAAAPVTTATTAGDPADPSEPPATPRTQRPAAGEDTGAAPVVVVAILVAAATVAYLVVVPLLLAWRRRRRRSAASTAAERVGVAWIEAVEDLASVGTVRAGAETNVEFAGRLARSDADRADAPVVLALARDNDAATFGGEPVGPQVAERSEARARDVARSVAARRTLRQRVALRLDPRPLLGGRGRRRNVTTGR